MFKRTVLCEEETLNSPHHLFSLCQCLAVPFQITSQKLIWALPENKFAAESDEAKHK
jgi:hypothetical protein